MAIAYDVYFLYYGIFIVVLINQSCLKTVSYSITFNIFPVIEIEVTYTFHLQIIIKLFFMLVEPVAVIVLPPLVFACSYLKLSFWYMYYQKVLIKLVRQNQLVVLKQYSHQSETWVSAQTTNFSRLIKQNVNMNIQE